MKFAFETERRAETDGKLAKVEERIYVLGNLLQTAGTDDLRNQGKEIPSGLCSRFLCDIPGPYPAVLRS